MGWWKTGRIDWGLFGFAQLAVVLIMLSTYFAGEYFDYKEDFLSFRKGKSKFAGGSGAIPGGLAVPSAAKIGSIVCLVFAILVGLIIQFFYRTGPWTIPLGAIGIIGGVLYSTPPVRWVSSGLGELWIGLCYGFLPVAVGFYLATGLFDSLVFFVGAPIAVTIFNVILANEFPDYESDCATAKRNLLVRIGRSRGAILYASAVLLSWFFTILAVWANAPAIVLTYYLIPFGLSAIVGGAFLAGKWRDRQWLEAMCGLGIVVNLGTTLAFLAAFLKR